jgi:hypothetical protein
MSIHGGIGGSEPLDPEPVGQVAGIEEERKVTRSWRLASGTLACPRCDAPVFPAAGPLSPAEPLRCPFCEHRGAVRDFLSLEAPTRPARVEVRVVDRSRLTARHGRRRW